MCANCKKSWELSGVEIRGLKQIKEIEIGELKPNEQERPMNAMAKSPKVLSSIP
jgi:hypothetical protein